jgi:hypothetical protein
MKIPATWTERDVITSSSSSALSTSPKKSRSQKPQQCLRFSTTMEVAEIPNRSDYSREEIEATWFQGYDYEEFRGNSFMTIGLYRAGLLPGGENMNHTMRGLECRLVEVSREREQTRYQATSAVLNEQYRQNRLGYVFPQAIADLYHALSWKSQYTAYTQAMLDEQEHATAASSKSRFSSRRSDAKNLLRKVIDIERAEDTMDASCSSHSLATSSTTDFDINMFFSEMTISSQ